MCGYELTVRNLHKAALMAARGAPVAAVLKQTYDTMAPMLTQDLWERQVRRREETGREMSRDGWWEEAYGELIRVTGGRRERGPGHPPVLPPLPAPNA